MRCLWPEPRDGWQLQAGQVTVWCVELDSPWLDSEQYRKYLNKEELEQASWFHFSIHQHRFILRRGLLRQFLGMYINQPVDQISFSRNSFGKPFLHPDFNSSLQFNISHSEDLVLMAFTPGRQIGVDIELHRPDIEIEAISRRFFSINEQENLKKLSSSQRVAGFFNCWTRKEALIKAIGQGLTLPLDQFEVSLTPGDPAQIMATHYDALDAERWRMCHLDVAQDYAAALVVEGGEIPVTRWRLTDGFFQT